MQSAKLATPKSKYKKKQRKNTKPIPISLALLYEMVIQLYIIVHNSGIQHSKEQF